MSGVKNCRAARVREQIVAILESWGMDREIVATTAEVMVETDLAGVDSHGVSMLMDYEASKSKGKLNVQARPHVVKETPVMALIDADAGLGHPAAVMGMKLAIEKAKAMGVAVVSVFNSHHFGAAGYYAALASKQGLVGMVTSATRSIAVVPTRAAVPGLGTNPRVFRPEGAFEDDLDAVIDVLHATPPIDPAQPVLVPGDPEAAARERRLREGIPLPASLLEKLRGVCERSGVAFLL